MYMKGDNKTTTTIRRRVWIVAYVGMSKYRGTDVASFLESCLKIIKQLHMYSNESEYPFLSKESFLTKSQLSLSSIVGASLLIVGC